MPGRSRGSSEFAVWRASQALVESWTVSGGQHCICRGMVVPRKSHERGTAGASVIANIVSHTPNMSAYQIPEGDLNSVQVNS